MLRPVVLSITLAVAVWAQKTPAIGVFIDFDAAPSSRSVGEMEKEAGRIMKSAGFLLDWRLLKKNQGRESFSQVVVVRFRGRCRLEYPLTGAREEDQKVASTLVSEGQVLPFSEVQCDEIRKALVWAPADDRQRALGRALGRVVAHELYHVLANTTSHAAEGLAKATHTWLELFSPSGVALKRNP